MAELHLIQTSTPRPRTFHWVQISGREMTALMVCGFYDSEDGRCESCDTCGKLNAFCNEGTDRDIVLAC